MLQVHDFLSGLDDSAHGVIRSQICAITPLRDLDSVYQTIVQNETIRTTVAQETQVMSFASQVNCIQTHRPNNSLQTSSSYPSKKDLSRKCMVCGCIGHEASAFGWLVIQSGMELLVVGVVKQTEVTVCSLMPTVHRSLELMLLRFQRQWYLQRLIARALLVHRMSSGRLFKKWWDRKPRTDTLSGKNDCVEWILDTGAIHHMTGRVKCLEDVRLIIPVSVRLPTGLNVLSSRKGTVFLNPHLTIS